MSALYVSKEHFRIYASEQTIGRFVPDNGRRWVSTGRGPAA